MLEPINPLQHKPPVLQQILDITFQLLAKPTRLSVMAEPTNQTQVKESALTQIQVIMFQTKAQLTRLNVQLERINRILDNGLV